MTHTTEQLAAFSATTEAEQLIIKNAVTELMNRLTLVSEPVSPKGTGSSQVLADEIGSEDPTPAEIGESNTDLAAISKAILDDSGPAISPATRMAEKATMNGVRNSRVFKINQAKVDPVLLALFEDIMFRAVDEKISGVKAVQMVISAHPEATRVAIKHTAALVGINPLSARNTYDHIKNDKN